MNHEPQPHIQRVIRAVEILADDAGWLLVRPHVSREGRSFYARLERSDGRHARLRVSDHRSPGYRVGKYLTRRGRLIPAMQVLTFRSGTMRALALWLRAHSLDWPRTDRPIDLETVLDSAYPSTPNVGPQALRGAVFGT